MPRTRHDRRAEPDGLIARHLDPSRLDTATLYDYADLGIATSWLIFAHAIGASSDARRKALGESVFGALPEPELNRLVGEVHECRPRAGHLLYDPEVTVAAGT